MTKWLVGGLVVVAALLAAAFYVCSEPDIPRAVLEAKYATPPSAFVVLNDGARSHYRDRGPRGAPVILLLHGSNSSLFDWEPWSDLLSDRFRVVSVDLPGHGLTGAVPGGDYSEAGMAAFVLAFADRLGLGRFAVAGNSMGGGVAARFAELHPDRVTHLILVDAHAEGMAPVGDHVPFAFRLARIPVLSDVLLHITPRSLVVEGLNDAVVRKAALTDAMIDQYWDFARMAGTREATVARFQLKADTFVRDHAAAIKAPTLILWGAQDQVLPVADAQAWARAIPGARLIVYSATGHLPMEEVPQKSAADVGTFVSAPH